MRSGFGRSGREGPVRSNIRESKLVLVQCEVHDTCIDVTLSCSIKGGGKARSSNYLPSIIND